VESLILQRAFGGCRFSPPTRERNCSSAPMRSSIQRFVDADEEDPLLRRREHHAL